MANRLSHSLEEIESHTPAIKSQDGNTGDDIMSKNGETIQEGDHVYTKIRGGRHEGDVLFTDQKGKDVAHNPGTLDVTDKV
ncbi:hypothetical protein PtrSN002B_002233 [Pyrenophora tritici-repentis]|uniref:Hypervirulence associated protein TUDOR domain-containing protein n=1 Tax=Pyrenophora tritici-repentis TaxID=45151 RepID=A0A2W1EBP4_9PLEO|nr:hypothetical protein PtrV1_06672 [Pyrenophora tritici-repentis]KAF7447724.1 hypothetical protein A1F99_070880 [Pyrenophora tritici-repentis]KAF7571415.1 hypothetical protein PtrM4_089150 [Pyrenophora tritici-repentis]KAG9385347.1 hypothetical protein A1F94_004894 [Pyrenophora tritici-repentis]KAI0585326.1 hypothetical protein Alg215_02557 [Pyrenophora tritici-repentis]